jgi:hypothetical protein
MQQQLLSGYERGDLSSARMSGQDVGFSCAHRVFIGNTSSHFRTPMGTRYVSTCAITKHVFMRTCQTRYTNSPTRCIVPAPSQTIVDGFKQLWLFSFGFGVRRQATASTDAYQSGAASDRWVKTFNSVSFLRRTLHFDFVHSTPLSNAQLQRTHRSAMSSQAPNIRLLRAIACTIDPIPRTIAT